MIVHESEYYRWIQEQGVGAKDHVASSPDSYISYLNSVSNKLGKDVSPQTLSCQEDVHTIARQLKGLENRPALATIGKYQSAMRQYVAMVKAGRISTAHELARELPVLFCYIGWTQFYDGTESVRGNFSWLKDNLLDNGESAAFRQDDGGKYRCGIGRGRPSEEPLHIVFVARDPSDGDRKVVGMYAAAALENPDADWLFATTRSAVMYPCTLRHTIPADAWPGHMGVRRWASRQDGAQHKPLRVFFEALRDEYTSSEGAQALTLDWGETEPQDEASALEGQTRLRLSRHRSRERKLREAKIREVLRAQGGRLVCEVPGCEFDFHERYGELGRGYAQVHHVRPLASLGSGGEEVLLRDLAIVCANCHAMIHRGGESRPLADILSAVSQDERA